MTKITMLAVAMAAATMGFPVFPVNPRNKKPMVKGWNIYATKDIPTIQRTWAIVPDAMIGVVMGWPSGRFVVDIDPKSGEDPRAILAEFENEVGTFEKEMIVNTPSGGIHIYVPMPPNIDLRSSTKQVWFRTDIKANGGYVIFPYSVRKDGKQYQISNQE